MIRTVWRRGMEGGPHINHASTLVPHPLLRGGAHNNTSNNSEQAQTTVKGGEVGGSSPRESMETICPRPPVCAPSLSGAPETVTPIDTGMSVRGSGKSMSVCAANSGEREKGEGGGRGFPPEGVLVVVPRRTCT